MKLTRTSAAVASLGGVIALVGGILLFTSGDQGDAAPEPASAGATALTAEARDTAGASLSGVAVRVIDSSSASTVHAKGTTDASGQVSLSFTPPTAGSYAVVADTPEGYFSKDDKDGGSSHQNGPRCDDVYLCVYLDAVELQNPDGTTSLAVDLADVAAGQEGDLDDIWFEMSPPNTAGDDESAGAVDGSDDDLLIGTGDDAPADDDESAGDDDVDRDDGDDDDDGGDDVSTDDEPIDDSVDPPTAPGLAQLCVNVRHQPVDEQETASGIWVRGEVYGLDGGWIWVEGPTINNGEALQIPVQGGAFDAPMGINSYGTHELERVELQSSDPGAASIDLLPTLLEGPGTSFEVDADEGPVFESECFDFEPPAASGAAPFDPDELDEQQAQDLIDNEAAVAEFFDQFVSDHVEGDAEHLLATLHPAVPVAFGESVCTDYVESTTGSIIGAEVLSVGEVSELELDTPNGPITFPEAIPFSIEFTLADDTNVLNDGNLVLDDGEPNWLTRCGD